MKKLITVMMAGLLLGGCMSTRVFNPENADESDLCRVKLECGTKVNKIDGTDVNYLWNFRVTPGEHVFYCTYDASVNNGYYTVQRSSAMLHPIRARLEKGGKYKITLFMDENNYRYHFRVDQEDKNWVVKIQSGEQNAYLQEGNARVPEADRFPINRDYEILGNLEVQVGYEGAGWQKPMQESLTVLNNLALEKGAQMMIDRDSYRQDYFGKKVVTSAVAIRFKDQ